MMINNDKELKKWVRESTLQELKDNIVISIGNLRNKQNLYLYMIAVGETMKRQLQNKQEESETKEDSQ